MISVLYTTFIGAGGAADISGKAACFIGTGTLRGLVANLRNDSVQFPGH
jgi:hypothetical protein